MIEFNDGTKRRYSVRLGLFHNPIFADALEERYHKNGTGYVRVLFDEDSQCWRVIGSGADFVFEDGFATDEEAWEWVDAHCVPDPVLEHKRRRDAIRRKLRIPTEVNFVKHDQGDREHD